MNAETLNAIYDILVQTCEAGENLREQFIAYEGVASLPTEFRFMGALGYGGKFRRDRQRWYVDCYLEDLTRERSMMIDRANLLLDALRLNTKEAV